MLAGIPFDKLTAPVLLGLAVLMVFLGFLVPRYVYKSKEKESEFWRLAYEAERKARAISDAQTADLLELAKTSRDVLVAVFGTTERIKGTGGSSWDSSGDAPAKKRSRLQMLLQTLNKT